MQKIGIAHISRLFCVVMALLVVTTPAFSRKKQKSQTAGQVKTVMGVSENGDSVRVTELQEVIVNRKRQKYSKKNNPAYDLMTRIRDSKHLADPMREQKLSYDFYDKMVLGINEWDIKAITKRNQYKFLEEFVDTNYISAFPVMLLSMREKAGTHYHSLTPRYEKELIRGQRNAGIDEAFNQQNINVLFDDVLRSVDIYKNDITLMQNRFVSPLSNIAGDFYKYFLNDTVTAPDGKKYIELVFTPRTPETFGFNGRLFVEAGDSTYFIKAVRMRVPRVINLNYIDNIYINQDFERDSLGNRQKTREEISLEMNLMPGTPSFFGHKLYTRKNFKYGDVPEEEVDKISGFGTKFVLPQADKQPWDMWEQWRTEPLTPQEQNLGSIMTRLRKIPFVYWSEQVLKVLVNGYITTGKKSKVDIGPVNTIISYNGIEGVRLRLGGVTTGNLSKHLFGRAYVAYGCKDRKWKYDAELEYSFLPKNLHAREFPVHLLRAKYKYDTDMVGQHYLFTNPDNVFLSLKRHQTKLALYKRECGLDYELELPNNFSIKASAGNRRLESTPWLPFIDGAGNAFRNYNLTEFAVTLRYAPGERFAQARSMRVPVNLDAPVFMLTHRFAPRNFVGSTFTLNVTEASVQKRFWFSAFGYADFLLKGGKIWSQVQYPELLWSNANMSYTIQPESFSLMNPMEFPLDYYGMLDVTYWMNGLIFNHIPLVKKLKLREVVTFKMLMGGLTSKNDPEKNEALYRFPENAGVSRLAAKPYMELSAGIDNILTILRVDYVWRLSYRDLPGVPHGGVRVSLHFSF